MSCASVHADKRLCSLPSKYNTFGAKCISSVSKARMLQVGLSLNFRNLEG